MSVWAQHLAIGLSKLFRRKTPLSVKSVVDPYVDMAISSTLQGPSVQKRFLLNRSRVFAPSSLNHSWSMLPPTALTDVRRPRQTLQTASLLLGCTVLERTWIILHPEEVHTSRPQEKFSLIGRILSCYASCSTSKFSQIVVCTNIQAQVKWAASLQYQLCWLVTIWQKMQQVVDLSLQRRESRGKAGVTWLSSLVITP